MLHPKTRRNIQKLIPFGMIWLVSGWVFLIVEIAVGGNSSDLPNSVIKMDVKIFMASSIAIAFVGLLTGAIELKYLSRLFYNRSFTVRLFYKITIYCLLFIVVVFVTFPMAASLELNTHLLDKKVWDKYFIYLASMAHLSTALQLATALVLSLFYSEINGFIGHGVLSNFFTGKYHEPVEEERLFLFLDMRSSTAIAEKLGHFEYFKLLREYYRCFTDAIIENEAEIYQYVGDEIILSWKLKGGRRDLRCLDCFFAMKKSLRKKTFWFQENFGIVPAFKAGIHFGKVTVGEIGDIKKDIMFSGDILNTASRMQSLCNSYNVDLIISEKLLDRFDLKNKYDPVYLGRTELRGKLEKMKLFTLNQSKEEDKNLVFQFEKIENHLGNQKKFSNN